MFEPFFVWDLPRELFLTPLFDFLYSTWPVGSLAATSATLKSSKPSLVLVGMFGKVET